VLPRITIDDVRPRTPTGAFPAKAVVDVDVPVSATIFRDGHDLLAGRARLRLVGAKAWHDTPLVHVGNDHWEAVVAPTTVGRHQLVVEAWTDRFATWRHDVEIKHAAGDDIALELEEGAHILESLVSKVPKAERPLVREAIDTLRRESCALHVRLDAGVDLEVARAVEGIPTSDLTKTAPMPLWVDRPRAEFGAWYEHFPRSEGGFAGAAKRLPAIAEMGFDVVYLPPIHPIGTTARKGRGGTLVAGPDDPGSPWAIGGPAGGHDAIDPALGTLDDLKRYIADGADHGLEIALDYALQCSPDHPWVTEHPEWFHHRPDGSIKYAENPPKKYQDIYPINFWPERDADRVALWEACDAILEHWIEVGIRIFRVDNPHTKPIAFWAWMLPRVQERHPDTIFLAEAFTRPAVMSKLAEIGFTQSYTYFTWRNEPWELRDYVDEVAHGPKADYMRPSFWTNTPDILSGPLRDGPPSAFFMRFVLASTLVPTYGMYSGYELFENEPASETNEEYRSSEKYEIKHRDWDRVESMAPFIARVNEIRRRHPSFQRLRDIRFHESDNDRFLVYTRGHATAGDLVLIVVNTDPLHAQETTLRLDLDACGVPWDGHYTVTDELTGDEFEWSGPNPYVRLDPSLDQVAHIFAWRVRGDSPADVER
jgi:starch synthase (maltosyl-transferring)